MLRPILVALMVIMGFSMAADAQIAVQVKTDRDTFLVYESISVAVNVRNYSGHTVELSNQGDAPWLSFLVTDESGATIPGVGERYIPEPITVPPGQTVSVTANLLPYYDLRQRGMFLARAIVNGGGVHVLSAPVRFEIVHGREIWKQTIGLPAEAGETNEDYRTYSLVLHRVNYDELLYVEVQDEPHDLVYGMLPLGQYIAVSEPSVKIDNRGHVHVLFRSGPRAMSYDDVAPDARLSKRAIYSDVLSVPQLVEDTNGTVFVHGGEQVYPRLDHVMTQNELNPPKPPPAKPPKKKHWWSSTPSTNTTSTASNTNAAPAKAGDPGQQ